MFRKQNTAKRPGLEIFFWAWLSLLTGELVLRAFCFGADFFRAGLLVCVLAPLPIAAVLGTVCPMLGRAGKWVCEAVLLIAAVLFGSQLVYFDLFKTFYTLFSMLHGGMVLSFFSIIVTMTLKNLPFILILFLPQVLFMILYRPAPASGLARAVKGGFAALGLHALMLFSLLLSGTGFMSPYDLYFKTVSLNESFEKLGALTAFRLDSQRYITGFEEKHVTPVTPSEQSAEGKNMLELDLSGDEALEFLASREATAKNQYTGMFRGKNLILVVAESFSPYVIDPVLTPTLYKMQREGFYFKNFYTPLWGVSTLDGEYATLLSLYPKTGTWSMWESRENHLPYAAGNVFSAMGYSAYAYHDHDGTYYHRNESHKNLGFDFKAVGMGLELTDQYPESDLEMIKASFGEYSERSPFCVYYLTMSGHMLYDFRSNAMSQKHRERVEGLPYSETVKAYIACQLEVEDAMSELLSRLSEAGELENTVIALVPDHYPYVLSHAQMEELASRRLSKEIDIYRGACLLYNAGMEPVEVDFPCANIDLMPMLLNLFGVEYDSRLLMGRDPFGTGRHLVVFASRSFLTDGGSYISRSGKSDLGEDETRRILREINNSFYYSAKILENDSYAKIFER